jgi:hypothetical protein
MEMAVRSASPTSPPPPPLHLWLALVGDEANSWALDGLRKLRWHAGKRAPYSMTSWEVGDVVGCLLDLDKLEMRFSINGRVFDKVSNLCHR